MYVVNRTALFKFPCIQQSQAHPPPPPLPLHLHSKSTGMELNTSSYRFLDQNLFANPCIEQSLTLLERNQTLGYQKQYNNKTAIYVNQ